MIKDFLISFRDNFKEKTRNPFLGTYLAVWLIRNWELIYTLFNFDKDCKLADKIAFIKSYYKTVDFLENLGFNILWAFGLLILTYLLLNISRVIVNLSEKRLTPWVYKKTDSKSIVLKSVYQAMMSERDELQLRLDQERESKSRLESRIKKLEEDLTEAKIDRSTEKPIEPIIKKPTEETQSNSIVSRTLFEKIKDKKLLEIFLDFTVKINKGESIFTLNKDIDEFIKLGLINYSHSSKLNESQKFYELTAYGQSVLDLARLEMAS